MYPQFLVSEVFQTLACPISRALNRPYHRECKTALLTYLVYSALTPKCKQQGNKLINFHFDVIKINVPNCKYGVIEKAL